MKKYLLAFLLLSLIGISSYHRKNIKCVFIASNEDFIAIEEDIFVSADTPLAFQSQLLSLIDYAKKTLQNFWEMPIGIPIIIYCHSFEDYQKLGTRNTLALCRLGQYLVISPNGLDHEILTHEMCHAVVFDFIERNYFRYYLKLPSWLDEGIALQFNKTGDYAIENPIEYKRLTIKELKHLDRPHHFYAKDEQIALENYKLAKVEVANFLENHKIDKLKFLLININSKKQFYRKYKRLNL